MAAAAASFLPFPRRPNPRGLSSQRLLPFRRAAIAGGGSHGAAAPDPSAILRRPVIPPPPPPGKEDASSSSAAAAAAAAAVDGDKEEVVERGKGGKKEWVDWEDLILQETVPLVGFVRMIIHSGKYEIGDPLSPEHEQAIMERLLLYHPNYEEKIGCGVDFITVGLHPEFENSRCLFIVRKDGEQVDFSFWKCVKGLIRTKYPLYADSFILRHFRWKRDR